jgi:hypothetical protein
MTDLFHRRELGSQVHGELTLLEALRWPTPLGSSLRLWLGRGAAAEKLQQAAGGEAEVRGVVTEAGRAVVTAAAGAGEGPVVLATLDGPVEVTTRAPEPELFEGLDTLCAQRHHEPPEAVADWLRYHVGHHGAEAALILDRGAPGAEREAFAAALEQLAGQVPGLRRLVLVAGPLPLGRPDTPALGDPATAPRRWNAEAAPDPWRAPLDEPMLPDVLRWRFLSRAAGVLALDVCELLDPREGPDVFTVARQSPEGLVTVPGEAGFAWRVRKDSRPTHADHVCRAMPPVPVERGWVAAPRRCAPQHLWLQSGVAGLRPVRAQGLTHLRCMSLLFDRSEGRELVVRERLGGDAALIDRARGPLGGDPVLPPKRTPGEPLPSRLPPPPSERTVVVTCMKNEGPFILEWLAHHRSIGVDDFVVYSNDCDDGTDEMLDLLAARGLLVHRENPVKEVGGKPQRAALTAAAEEAAVRGAGWILPIDVDEFVNVHVGEGRLPDLYAAVAGANAISLTWRLFGNNDIDRFEDRPVTEQFTRCAPEVIRRPHQAWGMKTLFRNQKLFGRMGVHRPRDLNPETMDDLRWVNGSGKPMPEMYLHAGWRSRLDSYGYQLVTLNHYSVRSAESYMVKRRRGRVNHVAHDQREGYWFRMNNNAEEERSITRHAGRLRAAIAELMADPEIAAAHARSVARHRAVIAELARDEDYAALYASITSERMKRMSRRHRHFGLNVFLNGPAVVPDEALAPELPPEYFFDCPPPKGRQLQ